MSNGKADADAMDSLHGAVAKTLTEAVKADEPDPRMLAVAVKFLKDNNVTALPDSPRMQNLINDLPFQVAEGGPHGSH